MCNSDPTKFFGCELGAQVKCDDKNERYIVNGDHDASKLQNTLDGFINKYVLCQSCSNPETDIIIKNDEILMDCKACGARNNGDMRHKLSAFIVKNPPSVASKNVRKQRKAATAQANNTGEDADNANGEGEGYGSDDDIISQRIQKQAAGLNMESKLALEDWSEDTSEAAVAQRMKELSVKGAGAFGDDDEEEGGENKYEAFGNWLLNDKGNHSDEAIIGKAEELGVLGKNRYRACQVLVQGIFDDSIISQIPKRANLLEKFVTDEKCQKAVLGGIERLVGMDYKEALLKKVPKILMEIYDLDIIEDEVFLKWGEKPSKRYVERDVSKEIKKAAAPFLEWLENAEEESEEESD